MLSLFKSWFGALGIGVLIGAVAVVGAVAVPATAEPVATASNALVKHVKRALGFSKQAARRANRANRRASGAVRLARSAHEKAGEPGPPGPEGPQGPQGEVGPTFGTIVGEGATPVEDPDAEDFPSIDANNPFSLPSPGRAFVSASFPSIRVNCSSGDGQLGLYLDGEPIPGTERTLPDETTVTLLESAGITEPLAAGSHTLESGIDCPSGRTETISPDGRITARVILLGG